MHNEYASPMYTLYFAHPYARGRCGSLKPHPYSCDELLQFICMYTFLINNTSNRIQPFFMQQSGYWLEPVSIHFFKMRIWCECTGAYGVIGCRLTLTCTVPLKLKELVGTHGPYNCVRTTHVPNAFHPQCMLLSFCPCHGLLAYKEERKKLERTCRRDEIRSLPH